MKHGFPSAPTDPSIHTSGRLTVGALPDAAGGGCRDADKVSLKGEHRRHTAPGTKGISGSLPRHVTHRALTMRLVLLFALLLVLPRAVPGAATPSITAYVTTPSSPAVGQQFTITITGNNFNSSTAQILFSGPGCSPCTVPNGVLSTESATLLMGPVTLNTAGSYTLAVQNGAGGATSK